MFFDLWQKIKEMISKVLGAKTIENTLNIAPIISTRMQNAIELWSDMYENKSPWLHEPDGGNPVRIVSLGLASRIAREKARLVTLEMKTRITPKQAEIDDIQQVTGSTERAEYLQTQYKKILRKITTQLEYGIAKGGLVIKPYVVLNADDVTKSQIEFDYIQANNFFPLAFDGGGKVTEAAFVQTKVDKDNIYRRLEHHKLEGNTIIVQNRAFKSANNSQLLNTYSHSDLGQEVPLSTIPEWANLQPETKIQNVDRLLFAYFKMPDGNTVEPGSPLGVSGYSRAVTHIMEADKQFSRILWEYEATEAAIDVDRDALAEVQDKDGKTHYVNPILQGRLFRPIDLGESNTYQPFLPTIRDTALLNGLNAIKREIEDDCELSWGTISEISSIERTATEITVMKQRSYSANAKIQEELRYTLEDVVYIMNVYASLYKITPEGEYQASIEFGDSVLTDVNAELSQRMLLKNAGIMSDVEMRMWYFDETEEQAEQALAKVDEEDKKKMESSLVSQFGNNEGEG
jgi:A118 family predicted phage portal protein